MWKDKYINIQESGKEKKPHTIATGATAECSHTFANSINGKDQEPWRILQTASMEEKRDVRYTLLGQNMWQKSKSTW